MTERRSDLRKAKRSLSRGELLFCALGIIALVLTFCFADTAIEAMSEGMRLCVSVVVPSLFPFMVVSDILVSSGGAELIAKPFSRFSGALFGLSGKGSIALMLGAIGGFPMGTRCALSMYGRGEISRAETEHLLCFCNGPSAAFLINAVGLTLFGSRSFGILLYCAQMLSAFIVGALMRGYFKRRGSGGAIRLSYAESVREKRGVARSIVSAVTGAAEGMLSICAFVIFFSAITGILRALLQRFGASEGAEVALLGFFEMTGGSSAASALTFPLSCLLVAAIVGWSGLSVHFQMIGLCKDAKVSLAPYFVAKAAISLLTTAIVALGLAVFFSDESFALSSAPSVLIAPALRPAHLLSVAVLALGVRRIVYEDAVFDRPL